MSNQQELDQRLVELSNSVNYAEFSDRCEAIALFLVENDSLRLSDYEPAISPKPFLLDKLEGFIREESQLGHGVESDYSFFINKENLLRSPSEIEGLIELLTRNINGTSRPLAQMGLFAQYLKMYFWDLGERKDSEEKSRRMGNKVWVKTPKVKGGGFWRKLPKGFKEQVIAVKSINRQQIGNRIKAIATTNLLTKVGGQRLQSIFKEKGIRVTPLDVIATGVGSAISIKGIETLLNREKTTTNRKDPDVPITGDIVAASDMHPESIGIYTGSYIDESGKQYHTAYEVNGRNPALSGVRQYGILPPAADIPPPTPPPVPLLLPSEFSPTAPSYNDLIAKREQPAPLAIGTAPLLLPPQATTLNPNFPRSPVSPISPIPTPILLPSTKTATLPPRSPIEEPPIFLPSGKWSVPEELKQYGQRRLAEERLKNPMLDKALFLGEIAPKDLSDEGLAEYAKQAKAAFVSHFASLDEVDNVASFVDGITSSPASMQAVRATQYALESPEEVPRHINRIANIVDRNATQFAGAIDKGVDITTKILESNDLNAIAQVGGVVGGGLELGKEGLTRGQEFQIKARVLEQAARTLLFDPVIDLEAKEAEVNTPKPKGLSKLVKAVRDRYERGKGREAIVKGIVNSVTKDDIDRNIEDTSIDIAAAVIAAQVSTLGQNSPLGIVGELGGDLVGGVVAKKVMKDIQVTRDAYRELKDDEEFQQLSKVKQLKALMKKAIAITQTEEYKQKDTFAYTADTAGFMVGNVMSKIVGADGMTAMATASLSAARLAKAMLEVGQEGRSPVDATKAIGQDIIDIPKNQAASSKRKREMEKAFFRTLLDLTDKVKLTKDNSTSEDL